MFFCWKTWHGGRVLFSEHIFSKYTKRIRFLMIRNWIRYEKSLFFASILLKSISADLIQTIMIDLFFWKQIKKHSPRSELEINTNIKDIPNSRLNLLLCKNDSWVQTRDSWVTLVEGCGGIHINLGVVESNYTVFYSFFYKNVFSKTLY